MKIRKRVKDAGTGRLFSISSDVEQQFSEEPSHQYRREDSQISLRGAPGVAMMQTADLRDGNDFAFIRRFDSSRRGRVAMQRQVRA